MIAMVWLASGLIFLLVSMLSVLLIAGEDASRVGRALLAVFVVWGVLGSLFCSSPSYLAVWLFSGITFLVSMSSMTNVEENTESDSNFFVEFGIRIIVWLTIGAVLLIILT